MHYEFVDDHVIAPEWYGAYGHPLKAFEWLRLNDPVRYVRPEGFQPFWAISKHADLIEIEKQPEIFVSEPRPLLMRQASSPEVRQEIMVEIFNRLQDSPKLLQVLATAGDGGLIRSLVQMDPPDHTQYRALVQPWFKPTNIKALEHRLTAIIDQILDDMRGDGRERALDFVQDVAVYPPLKLISELLGVPEQDEWRILKLTNELFAGDDPEMKRMADDPLSIFDTIKDIYDYFSELTDQKRANPTEDLASYIANGKIAGEYLPYKELVSYYTIIATAGHDTTRNAISGGLHALIENPDQWQLLQDNIDDEEAVKLAVEEMLRWTTPVAQFSRTATQDYTLRGKVIKAGDHLGLMYASANFDEAVFDRPHEFQVLRKPNRHLAFGTGPHQCLGLLLARLEMRLFFKAFIPRVKSLALGGEPERLRASFVHGFKHLPILCSLR
ncbi:MAG: cytochrome P450 [Pseudomonadales bacterium]|nr:cytochrome P450 [Pseudomonadales bacterium]MDA0760172.1 cytochrome P450 [Pseudomonadota bacterium]MDA1206783.1 cytochrome P450 [Pseudomonadota bacterium]